MTPFSQPLLTVNPLEMMKLWGELVECYHGVNGYGSDTAEIYAYRLMPYSPLVHSTAIREGITKDERTEEVNIMASRALVSLCEIFSSQYDCEITIGDMPMNKWLLLCGSRYDHRCLVRVMKL